MPRLDDSNKRREGAAEMMRPHRSTIRTRIAKSLIVICMLASCRSTRAQELPKHDDKARPKLRLVLEGGGALGLAHIGVITWM